MRGPGYEAAAAQAIDEWGAQQKVRELATLGLLAQGKGCRTALEVGTFSGGTAWYWDRLGMATIAVDVHIGRLKENLPKAISFIEVSGDAAKDAPNIHKHDLIFIDGDHSYDGVKADWLNYRDKANKLMAFHDIVKHAPHEGCQVDELWSEIKDEFPTISIIDPTVGAHPWAGIGVVLV